jgi:flavin reductase ActVB
VSGTREELLEARFRESVSDFATGVTVVTTADPLDGHWVGYTASAFASLSLRPPLVLACLDQGAECHPVFMRTKGIAVNILGRRQCEVARRFARKDGDKFAAGGFALGPGGQPVLAGASTVLECAVEDLLDAGDHTIIVARVERVETGAAAEPLLYHRGAFFELGAAATSADA